jgi:hypothetical protein
VQKRFDQNLERITDFLGVPQRFCARLKLTEGL